MNELKLWEESNSEQEWENKLVNLGTLERHVQFYIGDATIEGEEKKYIPKGVYDKVVELTKKKRQTIQEYVHICKSVKSLVRTKDLEYSHHKLIASLTFDKQKYYLDKAVENDWSVSNLREAIKTDLREDETNEVKELIINKYDGNMFYLSAKYAENRWDDKIIDLENDEVYPTITTLSRFFHKKTMKEFTLREYAFVQMFPDDFKFIGSYTDIKKQIGNAVSPKMGEYITKNFKGKTCGDLFAGCGGLTCGAEINDIKSKWAIEWNSKAAKSYKLNFPDAKVYNCNIKNFNIDLLEKVDIIIGGPPCQGFSTAGLRAINDPRNEMYKEFVNIVNALRPSEFLMENVKEIQEIKEQIIDDFNNIGYSVKTELIEGNNIEMKQNRIRFFFKGKRIDK